MLYDWQETMNGFHNSTTKTQTCFDIQQDIAWHFWQSLWLTRGAVLQLEKMQQEGRTGGKKIQKQLHWPLLFNTNNSAVDTVHSLTIEFSSGLRYRLCCFTAADKKNKKWTNDEFFQLLHIIIICRAFMQLIYFHLALGYLIANDI